MDIMFSSNNKISEHKSGPFGNAQSMPKWPSGLAYVGVFINYLLYLPAPFPRFIHRPRREQYIPTTYVVDANQ